MKHLSSFGTANRLLCILMGILMLAVAGCGGGGSVSSSGNAVNVSLASAPGYPAGSSFTASPTDVGTAAKPGASSFDNVFVEIWKVALLPSRAGEGPSPDGEPLVADSGGDDGAFVVAEVIPSVVVDLKNLPPGTKIASFLNRLMNVPEGSYGKIRIYYRDLWGVRGGKEVSFHPTAHSHFDVHFVGGDLVIPVTPDVNGGVRLYDVTIQFVGLKIVENPSKVLMRPQVFARMVDDVQYLVSGFADNVDKTQALGSFDIATVGRSFHTLFSYDDNVTKWAFLDNDTKQKAAIDNNDIGIAALQNGAFVDAVGTFHDVDTLFASSIVIVFPDSLSGIVAEGGIPPSVWQSGGGFEFFELGLSSSPADNVVILQPDRTWAYYDNAVSGEPLTDGHGAIDNNVTVKARGYIFVVGEGIQAYWISVGP